jgi:hypothetical protein
VNPIDGSALTVNLTVGGGVMIFLNSFKQGLSEGPFIEA